MGAQWKQKGREAYALKRGQIVGKLAKEIVVAAKMGGADPDTNPRLAAALEAARKQSVTRDTIDRALKRGAGQTDDAANFETVTYEGFAPHKVPVIVECLTDNRNRTAPEIRVLFKAGQLGSPGSVAWMFDHVGIVEAHHPDAATDLETAAIEAGAQNVEPAEIDDLPEGHIGARFITERADLIGVSQALKTAGWTVTTSEMGYVAKNYVEIGDVQRAEVAEFLGTLDDHDDVHRVYVAMK
jgi:YebC/PmpR family DNA-binding regulatory protein